TPRHAQAHGISRAEPLASWNKGGNAKDATSTSDLVGDVRAPIVTKTTRYPRFSREKAGQIEDRKFASDSVERNFLRVRHVEGAPRRSHCVLSDKARCLRLPHRGLQGSARRTGAGADPLSQQGLGSTRSAV